MRSKPPKSSEPDWEMAEAAPITETDMVGDLLTKTKKHKTKSSLFSSLQQMQTWAMFRRSWTT